MSAREELEVRATWLRSVVLVALGVIIGYFVIPLLKPTTLYGVRIHTVSAQDGCWLEWHESRQTFWEKGPSFGHGNERLKCKEDVLLLPNVEAECVCPAETSK